MTKTHSAPPVSDPWRNAVVVFLALLVVALLTLVWRQRSEIRQLSAVVATPTVTVLTANARSLPLGALRGATPPTDRALEGPETGESRLLTAMRPAKARPAAAGLARLLDSPEFFQLLELHRQSALDARFAALFRRLGLSTGELAKFKRLLAEKENVAFDVVSVSESRPEGPLSDEALRSSVGAAREQVESAIRESLGHDRYAMYREYERTLPQRTIVAQLEQRLSYSAAPLTPAQSDALVRVLVTHTPTAPVAAAEPPAGVVVGKGAVAVAPSLLQPEPVAARVTEGAIADSQSVLAPTQVAALREIQGEQQATARAMQLLRDNLPATDYRFGAVFQALLQ